MAFPVIVTVGGGKGGVGKSIITANLGTVLASRGKVVGFIDGDLAGANLHLYLGVKRPRIGLSEFLNGSCPHLREASIPTTVQNTWLISGASGILNLANPRFTQKQKIINQLKTMDADILFVDLGAGSSSQVVDFYAAFTYGIVVCDGLPTSVENAYGFLKNGIVRGMLRLFPGNTNMQGLIQEFTNPGSPRGCATIPEALAQLGQSHPVEASLARSWLKQKKTLLVLNMVRDRADIQVGDRFREIVHKYLGINLMYAGYVVFSDTVRASARLMTPAMAQNASPELASCFDALADNLIRATAGENH